MPKINTLKPTLSRLGLSFLLAGLCLLVYSPLIQAAETVIFRYKIFTESLSVSELRTFVDTGELSPGLKAFLKAAKQDPEEFRKLLSQPVKANGVTLSKVLNSVVGEFALDQISTIIHTPSHSASRQALRGAIVTSALPDNNISIIEILENYPTSEIYVEGDRLVEVYARLEKVIGPLSKIPF